MFSASHKLKLYLTILSRFISSFYNSKLTSEHYTVVCGRNSFPTSTISTRDKKITEIKIETKPYSNKCLASILVELLKTLELISFLSSSYFPFVRLCVPNHIHILISIGFRNEYHNNSFYLRNNWWMQLKIFATGKIIAVNQMVWHQKPIGNW